MRSKRELVIDRKAKTKDPQTLAILKKYVSEYPNNLKMAFKPAAEDIGLSENTLKNGWYDKKSPLYRENAGPCFMIVGKPKLV